MTQTTSLPDVSAAPTTITIRGVTYPLPAATLQDWEAICQRLREQVPNPMPDLVSRLAALPESLALKIYSETLTRYEAKTNITLDAAVNHAFTSPAGMAYLLWLLLGRSAPSPLSESELFAFVFDQQGDNRIADLVERIASSAGLRAVGEFLARAIRNDVAARAAKAGGPSFGTPASPLISAAAASTPRVSAD